MRVPICVQCNALMEQKRAGSKYVTCPNCGIWFAVVDVTVNHKDGDMKRLWVWQSFGKKEYWTRVSRGPGLKGDEPESPEGEPPIDTFQSEEIAPTPAPSTPPWWKTPSGTPPRGTSHRVADPAQGDPVPLAERQKQWDRHGRCGFTDERGSRCRYIDNGHRFHLCIGARSFADRFWGRDLDKSPDEGGTFES